MNSPALPTLHLDLSAEFPILRHRIFLNHASVSPLPRRATEAMQLYAKEAAESGGSAWPRWAERLKQTRQSAQQLLGAGNREIGFIHNTTHGLLCIANSLPWRPGDNIISTDVEFPANVYPWKNLAPRGVALRQVTERPDRSFAVDDFKTLIDSRTRGITVSMVQYSTGCRLPVEALAELCREHKIWLCLDAIQAVGAMPARPSELGCDFLSADAHKWMLGPEGIGLLYVREDRLDDFDETMTGWIARERFWDFADTSQPLQRGASRFEEGAHNMGGAAALGQSLGLINEIGIDTVWERIATLTNRLEEGLRKLDFTIISPRGEGQRSGILVAEKPDRDSDELMKRLGEREIDVTSRRGWLRFAPHFYNSSQQIDEVLNALAEILKRA